MKKGIVLCFLALLIIAAVLASGCSQGGSTAGSTPAPTQSQPSGSKSISDLINSAKQVQSMSLDYTVASSDGKKASGTIWGQKDKMLKIKTTSNGIQNVMLINLTDHTMTMYQPTTKQGTKIKESALGPNTIKPPGDYLNSIDPNTVKDLGTEVINSETCRVIQYTNPSEPTITEKMWLSQDLGYPIQITSTTADGKTTKINYTNIKEGALPGNVFNVPADIKIRDMTNMK